MVNSSNKVANSVIWSGIERLSVQGIQFVLTIILARLVLPSDYGLIALLTVFLVMAQVFVDSGFTMALIQKQNPTEKDFSTAFYLNLFRDYQCLSIYCKIHHICLFQKFHNLCDIIMPFDRSGKMQLF